MRLCEEYIRRHAMVVNAARHVRRGFAYLHGGSELLTIQWEEVGPHPGFYTISDCVLDTACRLKKSHRVSWDEYESFLTGHVREAQPVVTDRSLVFSLTWEYFVRKHENLLVGMFPPSEIFKTLDPSNESRLLDCMELVDRLGQSAPAASEFWHSRAFSVIDSYCYWLGHL